MAVDPNPTAVDDDGATTAATSVPSAAPSTAVVPTRTDARVAADTTTTQDDSPTVTVPTAAPIKQMLADPNIPGSLMTASQKGLATVQAMSAGIRAAQKRVQGVIDKVLNNEEEGLKARGADAVTPGLDAAKLRQAYPEEQVRIILDKRNAFIAKYNATADWDEDTPYSKLMQDVEKLNPHNVRPDTPAFATYVDMYNEAQKEALDHEKRRQAHYKQVREDTDNVSDQMQLPDNLRPDGVPPMSQNWLSQHQKDMSIAGRDKAAKFLTGGAEYSNRFIHDQLSNDALYQSPEDFRRSLGAAYINHDISTPDKDHLLTVNNEAQNDEGVKFIRNAMDVRILGNDHFMQSALQSLREKVIQMYRAGRGAHPEWNDSQRLEYAMKVEHENQVFGGEVMTSLAMTPYIVRQPGAKSREAVTPEMITAAQAAAEADNLAGRMTAAQKVNEMTNLEAWNDWFKYKANAQRERDAKAATKRTAK